MLDMGRALPWLVRDMWHPTGQGGCRGDLLKCFFELPVVQAWDTDPSLPPCVDGHSSAAQPVAGETWET